MEIRKRSLHKMKLKLQYLNAELDDCKEIFDEANIEFKKQFVIEQQEPPQQSKNQCHQVDISNNPAAQIQAEPLPEPEFEIKDKDIKKLFYQIVHETHPDKLSEDNKEKLDLYRQAVTAAEQNDEAELLKIASKLNIEPNIDPKKEIKWIQKAIATVEQQINQIQKTAVWIWYHADPIQLPMIEINLEKLFGIKKRNIY
jgi:hypothetical protein